MRLLVACSICFVYVLYNFVPLAHADSRFITVNKLSVEVVDQEIMVDSEVRFRVDEKVKAALSNGVDINFILELELRLQREIWPDSTLATQARKFRLKYHALSNQYILVNLNEDKERSFPDLYSAFFHMGRFRNLALTGLHVVELKQQYYIRARARLVSEDLPLPLRIKSYFSRDWRPSSGWTVWPM